MCTLCHENNFASNVACFKCQQTHGRPAGLGGGRGGGSHFGGPAGGGPGAAQHRSEIDSLVQRAIVAGKVQQQDFDERSLEFLRSAPVRLIKATPYVVASLVGLAPFAVVERGVSTISLPERPVVLAGGHCQYRH